MMINGEDLAKAIIIKGGFRDGHGQSHRSHGVFTFFASMYAHVCFDNHPDIGRQCWWCRMKQLQIYILSERIVPVSGSLPGSQIPDTGSGYLIDPKNAGMDSFGIDEFIDGLKESATDAVEVVKRRLELIGRQYRHATIAEQVAGIDLVPIGGKETWEVKSRFAASSKYAKIFVQLGETNPLKLVGGSSLASIQA
jgi:hypothetical protein